MVFGNLFISLNKKSGHLFVTGKKWDKMFEIKINN